MSSYVNALYISPQGEFLTTGIKVEFDGDEEAAEAFEKARRHAVDFREASFMLDLHKENGEVVDSIAVNGQDFARITDKKVLSEVEYRSIDRRYWEEP